MQALSKQCNGLVRAIAPSGNLFFLLSIQELRRQGLTFLAFYILQRTVEEEQFSEYSIRQETVLDDYEVSRACTFLVHSGLVQKRKSEEDARVRLLTPTNRGIRIWNQVLSEAAQRLQEGVPRPGRSRRLSEATKFLRKGNRILLGPLQLSFFDADLFQEEPTNGSRKNRKEGKPARGRPKRSEPS